MMKVRFERILFCLLILTVCLISPAFAVETNVVRDISTPESSSDSEFTVTLKISGTDVVGIVESIPEGFSYVGSKHPEDQVSQSGQNLIFSVIGETEINYQVKASSTGEGSFTGVWYNPISETEGTILDTDVSVNSNIQATQSSVNILSSEEGSQDAETKTTPFVGLAMSVAIIAVTGCYVRRH
ncbi:hypothetical protein [Methanolobus vulcani]|uniref:Uncharacterized protein n=1 Tax=Methanolobus vulcani TaxID=38026 RepID=A0A7Z8P2E4_9EURY|nr:hypothetical protein [Methanolobus vulcani]TQD25916.1 hypothetical protein FKV42_07010 [Methanolobus vulcani]